MDGLADAFGEGSDETVSLEKTGGQVTSCKNIIKQKRRKK